MHTSPTRSLSPYLLCIAEYITWDSRLTDYQTVHAVIAVLCIQIDGIEEGLARYVDNHNPI